MRSGGGIRRPYHRHGHDDRRPSRLPSYALRCDADDHALYLKNIRDNDWLAELCATSPRLYGFGIMRHSGVDDVAEATRGEKHDMRSRWSHLAERQSHRTRSRHALVGRGGPRPRGRATSASTSPVRARRRVRRPRGAHGDGDAPVHQPEKLAVDTPVISEMILGGALERHPVSGSAHRGRDRLGALLPRAEQRQLHEALLLDEGASPDAAVRVKGPPELRELPSRHLWPCNRHRVGIDTIMWTSDYPHAGSDWPNGERIGSQLAGFRRRKRKILSANAARWFGIEDEIAAPRPSTPPCRLRRAPTT